MYYAEASSVPRLLPAAVTVFNAPHQEKPALEPLAYLLTFMQPRWSIEVQLILDDYLQASAQELAQLSDL